MAPVPTVNTDYDDSWRTLPSNVCEYGTYEMYFLPHLYSLFFVLGMLGNAFVLSVKIFVEGICTMSDVCLLNLAVADLLLVCSLPFLAYQAWDQWLFGDAMCKLVLSVYFIGFYCGIFFIIVMSVDWYLAIVHVFSSLETRTRSVGRMVAAVIWLAGVLASFPELIFLGVQELPNESRSYCAPLYNSENYSEETEGKTLPRHFWTVFGLFKMNILGLLIPTAVMFFCYARTICVLRRSQRQNKNTQNAIRLALVIVAAFFCCWTPYNVASFLKALELRGVYKDSPMQLCKISKGIRMTLQITEVIAYSHGCLNPLLYFCVGGRFRRNLLKLIHCAPCKVFQGIGVLSVQDSARGPSTQHTQQSPIADEKCEDAIAFKQI